MKDNNGNRVPLEYSRKCCVEYDCKKQGHNWSYVNKEEWALLGGKKPVLFSTYASSIRKLLKESAADEQLKSALLNTPLLKWFLPDSRGTQFCSEELSVVLNTIAKEQTFKPFEVLSSVCDRRATINIRGLPKYAPCWVYFSNINVENYLAEFLLCMGEEKAVKKLKSSKISDLLDEFRFIRALHQFTPLEVKNDMDRKKLHVLLRIDSKVVDYMRGRVCGCLPIPGPSPKFGHLEPHINEPEVVKSPEIVVLSQPISESLEKLSQIWQDTFARAVLISAPSGSGKEELSQSIPYGNGRPTENFQKISMADCDAIALQQRLYGIEKNDNVYVPGLIELAKGSALFLDEIHQPKKTSPARANLLRTLEAGEYFATNGTETREVKNVLFIMATSEPLEKLKKINPRDFWTRMTHAIEIKHPLDSLRYKQKINVLSKFFNHFWWARIERFYGMKPVFGLPPKEILLDPSKLIVFWQVHSMTQIMGLECNTTNDPHLIPNNKKDKEKNYPSLFAENFLKEYLSDNSKYKSKQKSQGFTIRGIRSIVTRLFSIAASNVEKGLPTWETPDCFIKDVKITFCEISKIANLN